MSLQEQMWKQQRSYLQGAVNKLNDDNKRKRLNPDTASAGFLLLHTIEIIHYVAQMAMKQPLEVDITIQMKEKDEGREIDLSKVHAVLEQADRVMERGFQAIQGDMWEQKVASPFGEITRTEALGFLIYHTAYHVGQYMLTIKRGK